MPANAAVQQFIQAQLAAGQTDEHIKANLSQQGWDQTVIDDSFAAAAGGAPSSTTATQATQMLSGEKTSPGTTVLTIVLLWLLTPVGIIVMWTSTKWSKTVKWIITILMVILPIIAVIIFLLVPGALVAINPKKQFERAPEMSTSNTMSGLTAGIDRAEDLSVQNDTLQIMNAIQRYFIANNAYPTDLQELVAGNELDSSFADGVRPTATFTLNATIDGSTCELTVAVEGAEPTVSYCNSGY